jgi:hypothetical protein
VRFIMFRDSVKLPIRRDDLSKKILTNYKKSANLIMEEATERLRDVFGLTLTEVEGKSMNAFFRSYCGCCPSAGSHL